MWANTMIRFTPSQLRVAVGISPETYRHWKKALPPLSRGAGRGPRFTAGDLVAVFVVKMLTADFAIRVNAISAIAPALFETCNAEPWPTLERGKLVIDLAGGGLQFVHETDSFAFRAPSLVIPLQSSILHIRAALLTEHDHSSQDSLPFPPTPTAPSKKADSMEARA